MTAAADAALAEARAVSDPLARLSPRLAIDCFLWAAWCATRWSGGSCMGLTSTALPKRGRMR